VSAGAWEEYLAAARQLDAVRQSATAAASEHARTVQAAREELTRLRARLAPQQSRLRGLGVPEAELQPSPDEIAAAAQTMSDGPAAVLAALRQARVTADAADAAVVGGAEAGISTGPRPPWLRNLLVYGPYALVVFLVQLALYLIVDSVSLPALLCGLSMPAAAYGLGWLTIGLVFAEPGADRPVERTPVLGAAVCVAAPFLLSCVSAVTLRFLG
jgi:hypothetical protein